MISCHKILFVGVLSTLLLCSSAPAQAEKGAPPAFDSAAVDKQILGNGLTVLLQEEHSADVVAFALLVKTGSATEGRWMGSGISHFVEHMLFKGTDKRAPGKIEKEVKERGGYINAHTSYDYTVYELILPGEYLEWGLDLLSDVVIHAKLDSEETEKEREVVIHELQMKQDDPDYQAQVDLWSIAFEQHPYRHPVIGYLDLFKSLTHDDLAAYYRERYIPNNMILAIVGNIDKKKAGELTHTYFEPFQRKSLTPTPVVAEPLQMAPRYGRYTANVERSRLMMGFPGVSVNHPNLFALDVLATLLGQGTSSRLNQSLKEEKQWVEGVSASNITPHDRGLFGISSIQKTSLIPRVRQEILTQLNLLQRNPVSKKELQKAKNKILADTFAALQSTEEKANNLAVDQAVTGSYDFTRRYVEGILSVSINDIQRVAQQYLNEYALSEIVLTPASSEKAPPPPAVSNPKPTITKRVLPNGLTLLIRPDPTLPLTQVEVAFKAGTRYETVQTNGLSQLTAHLLMKGTTAYDQKNIAEWIESLGGSLDSFSGDNSLGLKGYFLSKDSDSAIGLISQLISDPTFKPDEVEKERSLAIANLSLLKEDITHVGLKTLKEELFKDHPYHLDSNGTSESLNRLRASDIHNFYKKIAVPNNMVVSVFGNVNTSEVITSIEKYLGSMQKQKFTALPIRSPDPLDTPRESIVNLPKNQALVLLGVQTTSINDPDRYALETLNAVLGEQSGRLFQHIRNKKALAYSVGSFAYWGLDTGFWGFYAATTPETAVSVRKMLREEIEQVIEKGITEEELASAKQHLIGLQKISTQSNENLIGIVTLDELYGLGYEHYLEVNQLVQNVSMQDIQRVIQRFLSQRCFAVVVVQPDMGDKKSQ